MCLEKVLGLSTDHSHIVGLFRPNSAMQGHDSVVELVELKFHRRKIQVGVVIYSGHSDTL